MRIILRSGFPTEWLFKTVLIEKMNFNERATIHDYIILQAIVTNNYSTYVEDKNNVPGLINVISTNHIIPDYDFMYLMILSYLNKNHNKYLSVKDIKSLLNEFYDYLEDLSTFDDIFYTCITKLLNKNLIESPEAYEIEFSDDVKYQVRTIRASILGNFYIDNLIYNYDYLVYIKDEINLNQIDFNGTYENRKLSIKGDFFNYYKYNRFNFFDIITFLEEFADKELNFLITINTNDRLVPYIKNFTKSNCGCYSHEAMSKILSRIDNDKFEHQDILKKMRRSKIEIYENFKNELKISN